MCTNIVRSTCTLLSPSHPSKPSSNRPTPKDGDDLPVRQLHGIAVDGVLAPATSPAPSSPGRPRVHHAAQRTSAKKHHMGVCRLAFNPQLGVFILLLSRSPPTAKLSLQVLTLPSSMWRPSTTRNRGDAVFHLPAIALVVVFRIRDEVFFSLIFYLSLLKDNLSCIASVVPLRLSCQQPRLAGMAPDRNKMQETGN